MAHKYGNPIECTGPVRLHVEIALGKPPGSTQGLKPSTGTGGMSSSGGSSKSKKTTGGY